MRKRPPLKRLAALKIAGRFFRDRKSMHPGLREEIVATQMPRPEEIPPPDLFAGWTTDEMRDFAKDGTVPKRYRK